MMAIATLMDGHGGRWRRERQRYVLLQQIYEQVQADCSQVAEARRIGTAAGLELEEIYRAVHFLESRGYLNYVGSGPRVSLTHRGVDYLEREAGRRRSVRDESP